MRLRKRWWIALVPLGLVLCAGLWLYFWLLHDLPSPERFADYVGATDNPDVYSPVPLDQMPDTLRWAVIAMDDPSFYAPPVQTNWRGLLRGAWYYWRGYSRPYDGSIARKLARELMAVSESQHQGSLRYQLQETMLKWLLIRRYTRDEILAFYLNSLDYSDGLYGVEPASQFYFGKPVHDLGLAENAMLVSIYWHRDWGGLKQWERTQVMILEMMVVRGYISQEEAAYAAEEALNFVH